MTDRSAVGGSPDAARPKPDTGNAGIVLAGGRSERFPGGDKALASLGRRPLLAHAVDTLSPVADEIVVNCREDQRDAFGDALEGYDVRFAVDAEPDRGPVAGLSAALAETSAVYAVTLPCDRPAVEAAFLAHLLVAARGQTGAVPRFDGRRRPFPLAVHVRAGASACANALDGAGSLDALLDDLAPVAVPEAEVRAHATAASFRDVNTPAELRRLAAVSAVRR